MRVRQEKSGAEGPPYFRPDGLPAMIWGRTSLYPEGRSHVDSSASYQCCTRDCRFRRRRGGSRWRSAPAFPTRRRIGGETDDQAFLRNSELGTRSVTGQPGGVQ